ncbi:MAG: ABC transporter permease [Paludibacter sp.]
MKTEFFIAKRIYFQQGKKNVSRPAVRIAIIAIALGMTVMLASVAVVLGFKKEVRNKVVGFGGHIRVSSYDHNNSFETNPVTYDKNFIADLQKIQGLQKIQTYATKPGIIKTDTEFQGIVLKGVSKDFDWQFFQSGMQEGSILHLDTDLKNEVILSQKLADMLQLKLGDSFYTYFLKDQVKARKFKIAGIYTTGFEEFDKLFVITDLRHIQQLNGWNADQYSGYELIINDFEQLEAVTDAVLGLPSMNQDVIDIPPYFVQNIKELNPGLFSWFELLDLNVWIILGLMLVVAGFNMISGLLILILERTNMIGILKSLGAGNWSIRKVFLIYAAFLIARGMFWGNVIGLSLCTLQYYTHIIPLDPEGYYVNFVPVLFNWTFILLLNAGTFVASFLMMIAPSYLIAKLSPAKIIRYE